MIKHLMKIQFLLVKTNYELTNKIIYLYKLFVWIHSKTNYELTNKVINWCRSSSHGLAVATKNPFAKMIFMKI
jgi:uncharacterized ion transporter superfamily protein YfcC